LEAICCGANGPDWIGAGPGETVAAAGPLGIENLVRRVSWQPAKSVTLSRIATNKARFDCHCDVVVTSAEPVF
jgi:hypothetical protein